MGCVKAKPKATKVQEGEFYAVPTVATLPHELEQVAELPIRARNDDADLLSSIVLFVQGKDLPVSSAAHSQVQAVLYRTTEEGYISRREKTKLGQTENVKSAENPQFIAPFRTTYSFEEQQTVFLMQIQVEIIETSQKNRRVSLGSAAFSIHELVCAPTLSVTKALGVGVKRGTGMVTVTTESCVDTRQTVAIAWTLTVPGSAAGQLYLRVFRKHAQTEQFIPVYESEALGVAPYRWKRFELATYQSTQSQDFPLLIEVHRSGKGGKLLGSVLTDIAEVKFRGTDFRADIEGMELGISEMAIQEDPGFLDYIFGGCEVSLLIAIDFTKSNGQLGDPGSLHYQEGAKVNEYMQAISAVGDILQYYDSDKKIPVFGFGAKLPPSFTHVSHCFALNGNIFDPEVQGIEEVVSVYRKSCQDVHFHGPTIFSHIIHMTAECAARAQVTQDNQRYFLLLIITDGIINDMEATVHEIVEASSLPLSIIIVGVGNEDFSMMKDLDSDDKKLVSRTSKKTMERDIVQFVPYRLLKDNQMNLAREVLYEVPTQLISYMTQHGIRPGLPKGQQLFMDSYRPLPAGNTKFTPFDSLREQFVADMEAAGYDLATIQDLLAEGILASESPYVSEMLELLPKASRLPTLKSSLRKEKRCNTHTKTVRIETEKKLCRVCYVEAIEVVLLECGHRAMCQKCVETLKEKVCPLCRQPIARWVRTFDT